MAALAVAGTAFSLVSNAKKAVDILRDVSVKAPAEARFLAKLVQASLSSIAVAKALANREEAIDILAPALDLISETLANCEDVLEDGEMDATSQASSWFLKKTDGISKKDIVSEFCRQIQAGQQLLQLCLCSLQAKCPGFNLEKPFVFDPLVVSKAHDWLLEFEYGRVKHSAICFGMLGKRNRASSIQQGSSSVWQHLHYSRVHLVIEDGKKCKLVFHKLLEDKKAKGGLDTNESQEGDNSEENSEDEDGQGSSQSVDEVVVDRGTRCFRYTKREMKGLEVLFLEDKFDIVYQIDNYLLHFERCAMVSAELFEAILSMCKLKDAKYYLSQVIQIDKPPDLVKMKQELAEIGPYWEDGGSEHTAQEHQVYEQLASINIAGG